MENEKRLIDANFTKAVIQNYIANNEVTEAFVEIAGHICGMLDACETVDAVEVVHAYWIKHEYAEEENGLLVPNYECSACHSWERDEGYYCPNCGAKMGGERKDNG